jgi:hypothetical protein
MYDTFNPSLASQREEMKRYFLNSRVINRMNNVCFPDTDFSCILAGNAQRAKTCCQCISTNILFESILRTNLLSVEEVLTRATEDQVTQITCPSIDGSFVQRDANGETETSGTGDEWVSKT